MSKDQKLNETKTGSEGQDLMCLNEMGKIKCLTKEKIIKKLNWEKIVKSFNQTCLKQNYQKDSKTQIDKSANKRHFTKN